MNNFANERFSSKHVKKKTVNTLLSIDSKFRKDYFKTDPANFSVKLSVPFKNVLSMKLSSLELQSFVRLSIFFDQKCCFFEYLALL